MAARDLIGGIALVGAGYLAWRMLTGQRDPLAPLLQITDTIMPTTKTALDYYGKLAKAESSNRPYVKAATSSASGLYQFTRGTWQRLGGQWGADLTKAFGGLFPTVEEQRAMIEKLTRQNEGVLSAAGIALTDATRYAAHFLGAGVAASVLRAPPNVLVSSIVKPEVIAANRFLTGMTVADFGAWLQRKMR